MTRVSNHRRAMQGGNIEGAPQIAISRACRHLIKLIQEQMTAHGAPSEHWTQETASILIQVLIEEFDDPTDFVEGAMTQLGWQIGSRSTDVAAVLGDALRCLWNGVAAGQLEPLAQEPAGSA